MGWNSRDKLFSGSLYWIGPAHYNTGPIIDHNHNSSENDLLIIILNHYP